MTIGDFWSDVLVKDDQRSTLIYVINVHKYLWGFFKSLLDVQYSNSKEL